MCQGPAVTNGAGAAETVGKPIHCKAAVLWSAGGKYALENIVVAPPKKDQVRIKILYTSICHTDVTCSKFKEAEPLFPVIFGHEAAGIVESVGSDATNVEVGDHVLPYLQGECDDCEFCSNDKATACKKRPLAMLSPTLQGDSEPVYTTEDGKPISVFLGLSTFSQYIVVHKDSIAKISPAAPLEKVGPLACGLATGLGAVWNVAKVPKGATVAVFGLGTIGLAVVQACKIAGASKIIGVDVNPNKADVAKTMGVTDFINPKDHPEVPTSKVITDLTGEGVEYSFECVGLPKLMSEAVESTIPEVGVTVILGLPQPTDKFEINALNLLRGKTVMGTMLGRYKVKDLPGLVERSIQKDFDLSSYITHTLPLSKIDEAMNIFESGECLRINMSTED